MAVGPESSRESQKEESGGEVTQSERITKQRREKNDPKCLLTLVSETSAVGLENPRETKEKESGGVLMWHAECEKCT